MEIVIQIMEAKEHQIRFLSLTLPITSLQFFPRKRLQTFLFFYFEGFERIQTHLHIYTAYPRYCCIN